MRILVFGDIVGGIGREAVIGTLPGLRAETNPDLVIANCENLAGGLGVTPRTLDQMIDAGVDAFTSGNHLWDRPQISEVLADNRYSERLVRPANYPPDTPGRSWILLTVGEKRVLVLNFVGKVFSNVLTDNPFRSLDKILVETAGLKADIVLVDFHAEATSEKIAFGWHTDGRAAAVWGTHTHVPTRDERILTRGTAYITDVGMTGLRDGVIGVEREP
ncbi:MAG: TIGR00282 family metallophosphoesterase, partial [bacterium]